MGVAPPAGNDSAGAFARTFYAFRISNTRYGGRLMPIPTQYSEADLAQFSITALGPLASALGWDVDTPQVAESVNDALLGYFGGTGLVADATDVAKLRAWARVAIWRRVRDATAGNYRVAVEVLSYDRQQVHEHAVAMVAEAEREAGAVGAGPALVVGSVVRDSDSDPYAAHPSQWGVSV